MKYQGKSRTVTENILKDEKGSVQVIEAALVYPVVIFTVVTLIYMGMYIFDASLLNDRARMAAVTAAKTVTFTGYDELGDVYSSLELDPKAPAPDRAHVDKYYSESSPYRYFVNGKADDRFAAKVCDYASDGLFRGTGVTCTVDVRRKLFDREVVVTVEKNVSLPGILRLSGVRTGRKMTATASAVTSDPAEFVRNTDLAMDAASFIGNKTGINGKLAGVRTRISEALGKLKAGSK